MYEKFTMNGLSSHIIALANKYNLPITNLQLQKVLYFTLRFAILNNCFSKTELKNLYNEPFLVWRYGPVEKSIYEEYKIFGSDPIIEISSLISKFNCLNNKIIELLKEPVYYLVSKSHEFPFWKRNSNKIIGWRSNVEYNLYNIKTGN